MADLSLRAESAALNHGQRLAALAAALREGGPWWRPRPFVGEPAWVAAAPAIAAWCEALDEAAVARIEEDDWPEDAPAELLAWRARLAALTALPAGGAPEPTAAAAVAVAAAGPITEACNAVPERKVAQVAAFVAALGAGAGAGTGTGWPARVPTHVPTHVVDWCGGKGHLGRRLGALWAVPVTVIDRVATLVADAEALGRRDGVQVIGVVADALADPLPLGAGVLAVGLHACGALGQRLLEQAADGGAAVALAPCCLHKIPGLREHGYRPVSAAGRACDPGLDHAALRLATADEVIARASLRRGRQRESAYRLGLDRLLRIAGRESYTPLGVVPSAWLSDFEGFCRAVAARDGLTLPTTWDPIEAEAAGWAMARRARALGLVRGMFRRAIELWVALDRVAFLEESGLEARVMVFAPRAVTPRNVLILARRAAARPSQIAV